MMAFIMFTFEISSAHIHNFLIQGRFNFQRLENDLIYNLFQKCKIIISESTSIHIKQKQRIGLQHCSTEQQCITFTTLDFFILLAVHVQQKIKNKPYNFYFNFHVLTFYLQSFHFSAFR